MKLSSVFALGSIFGSIVSAYNVDVITAFFSDLEQYGDDYLTYINGGSATIPADVLSYYYSARTLQGEDLTSALEGFPTNDFVTFVTQLDWRSRIYTENIVATVTLGAPAPLTYTYYSADGEGSTATLTLTGEEATVASARDAGITVVTRTNVEVETLTGAYAITTLETDDEGSTSTVVNLLGGAFYLTQSDGSVETLTGAEATSASLSVASERAIAASIAASEASEASEASVASVQSEASVASVQSEASATPADTASAETSATGTATAQTSAAAITDDDDDDSTSAGDR
ncbi:uncharacterized protein ASCRUDRAFT_6065, partial [Ascoidea rubescens DSM 1968]